MFICSFSRSVLAIRSPHRYSFINLGKVSVPSTIKNLPSTKPSLRKTDDITRRHQRFPREMTSEKERRNSILMTCLPRSGECFWLVEANLTRGTTNQKQYSDLGSDALLKWNFCTCFFDVISRANRWWRCEMSSVFSGSTKTSCQVKIRRMDQRLFLTQPGSIK